MTVTVNAPLGLIGIMVIPGSAIDAVAALIDPDAGVDMGMDREGPDITVAV